MPRPLDAIKTIVVVMMENRSFDHVLGFLSHEDFDRRTDVDGLHRPSDAFSFTNFDEEGSPHDPCAANDEYLPWDMPHGRAEIQNQIMGGSMAGFMTSYLKFQPRDRSPIPMRFCKPQDIPITAMLARNYTVCDRWFASLPDDTFPNRLMSLSGRSRIDDTSVIKPLAGKLIPDQDTVFDWLTRKGLDYRIYVDAHPVVDVGPPASMLLMQSQWGNVLHHADTLDAFDTDWRSNRPAPAVIYCEPFFNDFAMALTLHGNCNHPPLPMAYGESFLRQVYTTLIGNPAKWKHTMLIVCYDEHGGFFDHVSPPSYHYGPPDDHKWLDPTPFATLGCRIPGLVISPLADRPVFSGLLDHTSILQLMVDKFGAPDDLRFFGDAPNRKAAGIGSLADTLTRTEPLDRNPAVPLSPHRPNIGSRMPPSTLGELFVRMVKMKPRQAVGLL